VLLGSIPPSTNIIWQQDSEQQSVDSKNVIVVSFRDDPCRESDTNRERLLSVGVTILDKVVTDILVGQRLIGFGKLDKVVVEFFKSLVAGWTNLIRVIFQRQLLVMGLDSFFIGTLWVCMVSEILSGGFPLRKPTILMPKISYGSQILPSAFAVTAIRYAIYTNSAHPMTIEVNLLSRLSFLFCVRRAASIASFPGGL